MHEDSALEYNTPGPGLKLHSGVHCLNAENWTMVEAGDDVLERRIRRIMRRWID